MSKVSNNINSSGCTLFQKDIPTTNIYKYKYFQKSILDKRRNFNLDELEYKIEYYKEQSHE
jgi:hypothetical protein